MSMLSPHPKQTLKVYASQYDRYSLEELYEMRSVMEKKRQEFFTGRLVLSEAFQTELYGLDNIIQARLVNSNPDDLADVVIDYFCSVKEAMLKSVVAQSMTQSKNNFVEVQVPGCKPLFFFVYSLDRTHYVPSLIVNELFKYMQIKLYISQYKFYFGDINSGIHRPVQSEFIQSLQHAFLQKYATFVKS